MCEFMAAISCSEFAANFVDGKFPCFDDLILILWLQQVLVGHVLALPFSFVEAMRHVVSWALVCWLRLSHLVEMMSEICAEVPLYSLSAIDWSSESESGVVFGGVDVCHFFF